MLRTTTEDYKNSIFASGIQVFTSEVGFNIKVRCQVENNAEFLELIADGSLSYGLQIQCTATWMRKFIRSSSPDFSVLLTQDEVYEKVEICPCIVANKDIEHFTNEDFSDDYLGMMFKIRAGELVACSTRETFDAIYKKDILKNTSSIFYITCKDEINTIEFSPEYEKIYIYLPQNTYELYNYHKLDEVRHAIINAAIIVPILVQILNLIRDSRSHDDFLEKRWYKTIKNKLTIISRGNSQKYDQLLDNPVSTAQLLVGDSAFQALTNLKLLVEKGE